MSLYLLNSWIHASREIGNKIPEIGSHSVIDNPESDILVYPPIKIIDITHISKDNSQIGNRLILFNIIFNFHSMIKLKKIFSIITFLFLTLIYILVIMTFLQKFNNTWIFNNWILELIVYFILGNLWIFPSMYILKPFKKIK